MPVIIGPKYHRGIHILTNKPMIGKPAIVARELAGDAGRAQRECVIAVSMLPPA